MRKTIFLGTLSALLAAPVAGAAPLPEQGLVLWLDASDPSTLGTDAASCVARWADKSACQNHAVQTIVANQPKVTKQGLGSKPTVRFDGTSYLNLGRPAGLDFRPGRPFSIIVVCRSDAGQYGTFLSQGGETVGQRAYQFYTAPGRIGAVVYGRQNEAQCAAGPHIAALVCGGAKVQMFVDDRPALSVDAGHGAGTVDVLIGARRRGDDNTGAHWGLTGEISELLVYNRPLDGREMGQVANHLREKYALPGTFAAAIAPAAGIALRTAADVARLPALATQVAEREDAVDLLRSALQQHPQSSLNVAETLLRIAEKNRLAEGLAELAGELLVHPDPFTRGLAEWAISLKVGVENNGQLATWPKQPAAAWYSAYVNLPQSARQENDSVRQAVALGIHRDPVRLLASVETLVDRARQMADALCNQPTVAQRLAELERLRSALSAAVGQDSSAAADLALARRIWLEARRAMRDVALANPAIDFRQLIFLKQFVPHTVRNITRSYSWKHKPGGDICILDSVRDGQVVQPLLAGRLGPGYVWGLDLWWDADRVVFSYARQPHWPPPVDTANHAVEGINVFRLRQVFEPLHLFECSLDGSAPVQLTDDPYWSDFEPTYCASGDVVFASDRCGRAAECGNDTYDHTNPNLYLFARHNGQVRKLTDSKDIDRYPHSLDDGRIAYTHWEYQERHFMEVHALWTLRPDGTMSDALYKQHMPAPLGLRDTRSIPGSTKLVSIAAGHHSFAYGPVVIADATGGLNAAAGLSIVTPNVKPLEGPMAGQPVAAGGVCDGGGLYQTPWSLSESCFLVSYAYARPACTQSAGVDSNAFGLYLIDVFGNRELLHRDPVLSCTVPLPLRKRVRPPVVAESRPALAEAVGVQGRAVCYVSDVYDGLTGVNRGSIKTIRVAQRVPWPFDAERGQQDYLPGNAGTPRIDFPDWAPVRVIGTVPVESDGSAHFTVPADTALYFQALDERGMELMRMRSFVSFKAGEVRGCRGCHESQAWAPRDGHRLSLAVQKPPVTLAPPAWGAERLLGYEWLVQPILDRHCTDCHGAAQPDGEIDLSATRAADGLLQSFRTLQGVAPGQAKATRPVLIACSDRFSNADVTRPLQFGSHRSRLVRVLLDDALHREKVHLSQAEWDALVTWVDANAPYHDAFLNKRPAEGKPRREVRPTFTPLATTGQPESP